MATMYITKEEAEVLASYPEVVILPDNQWGRFPAVAERGFWEGYLLGLAEAGVSKRSLAHRKIRD